MRQFLFGFSVACLMFLIVLDETSPAHPVYTKTHVDHHIQQYQSLIEKQATSNRILRRRINRGYPLQQSIIPWINLARCESGNRWSYNGSSGFDGGLQFSPATWRGYGGQLFAPYAWQATPIQQVAVAQLVLNRQGRGAWPGCTRKGAW